MKFSCCEPAAKRSSRALSRDDASFCGLVSTLRSANWEKNHAAAATASTATIDKTIIFRVFTLGQSAPKKIPADGSPRRPANESGFITVSATATTLQLRGGMWLNQIRLRTTETVARLNHVGRLNHSPYAKLTGGCFGDLTRLPDHLRVAARLLRIAQTRARSSIPHPLPNPVKTENSWLLRVPLSYLITR
jgi:hypothetical protein